MGSLVKAIAQKFGRKSVTAMELTVEHMHIVMDLLTASERDPLVRATQRVMVLLLFLAGFRISEAAGHVHAIPALGVTRTAEFLRLTRPDSKTHVNEVVNYVTHTTQSGLSLGGAVDELVALSGMRQETVVVTMRGQPVEAQRIDYYVLQLWLTAEARPTVLAAAAKEVTLPAGMAVVKQRLKQLEQLFKEWPTQFNDSANSLRATTIERAKLNRHPSERFVNLLGGTRKEMELLLVAASKMGITLRLAPGPLLRSTRYSGRERARVFTHMPLSTSGGGNAAAQLFRSAATKLYMKAGLSFADAKRRAQREPWTSHGGRRGCTTEIKARLAKFKAEHPELVTEDMQQLVNLHLGWADDDMTTQDHYTGMRCLMEILLLTMLL